MCLGVGVGIGVVGVGGGGGGGLCVCGGRGSQDLTFQRYYCSIFLC